jgi:FkbM family methyltransferase
MYKNGEIMKLEYLKDNLKFNPKTILDVGAHKGQFYTWAKEIWPESFIWMLEANEYHTSELRQITINTNDKYTIAAIGDFERDVTFYTRTDKPHTEGNSYYKEADYWDIPHLVMETPKKLQTLDILFDTNSSFDLIKIDTQGSELDIIKGGLGICKKSSYIILEVAVTEYNLNAPLEDEVINYMKSIEFENIAVIGEHINNNNEVIQKDILFKNKKIQ